MVEVSEVVLTTVLQTTPSGGRCLPENPENMVHDSRLLLGRASGPWDIQRQPCGCLDRQYWQDVLKVKCIQIMHCVPYNNLP